MFITVYMIANMSQDPCALSGIIGKVPPQSLEKLVDLFDLVFVGPHNEERTASKPQSNDAVIIIPKEITNSKCR